MCSVTDCTNPVDARGWCQKHYKRWKKTGTTDAPVRLTDEERFLSHLTIGPRRKGLRKRCRVWTGFCNEDGYGSFSTKVNGKWRTHIASRWAYEHFVGPIPDGHLVCHTCDFPSCCEITHLFLGTIADNNLDMVIKGRQARGSRAGGAKLTENDVLYVHDRVTAGDSYAAIAKHLGISRQHVRRIATGRSWPHLSPPPSA